MEKKKVTENIVTVLLLVLFFPIVLLFLIWALIITPFDYFKYKSSQYYKDTHEKYSWLCTSSYYIKLYDLIKKENLPIDFYRSDYAPITGYGYFVYKDILILNDYEPCFDAEKNIWTVEIEDEYVDIKDDVEETITRCNELLKADICKRAVVLVDGEVLQESPNVEYDNFCLVAVDDDDEAEVLREIIEQTNAQA